MNIKIPHAGPEDHFIIYGRMPDLIDVCVKHA